MTQIIVYPRLYTTRLPNGEGVLVSKGDAALETLYEFLVNRSVNTSGWAYRKEVLDTALRLFGDFRQWLKDQQHNSRIVGYNLQFIHDTMNFIQTGQRELSLANWIELVAEGDDIAHSAVTGRPITNPIKLAPTDTTVSIIQSWCGQPHGLEDMLGAMHVFFGRARKAQK